MNINMDLCRSDINNPDRDMKIQLEHIREEISEANYALSKFEDTKSNKERAELLFELLDIINATQTAISMEFTDEEVAAGCQYVNAKNFVRHYLLEVRYGEKEEI